VRFNAAPINGAAFNADVPKAEAPEPINGGGGSFPGARGRRGTALFATAHQPEPEEAPAGPLKPVVAAVQALDMPRRSAPAGPNALRRLVEAAYTAAPSESSRPPDGLAVDVILVQIQMTLLRLEMDVLARLQDEEDEAIALLMLSDA
jgi:hypothetical protein